jgi:hypothetical protein
VIPALRQSTPLEGMAIAVAAPPQGLPAHATGCGANPWRSRHGVYRFLCQPKCRIGSRTNARVVHLLGYGGRVQRTLTSERRGRL